MPTRALIGSAALAALLSTATAVAAERTVKLAVDGMYCFACPYIVEQSLAGVPGVARVEVSLGAQTATVTFDDATASLEALTAATTNAGFPSRLAERGS